MRTSNASNGKMLRVKCGKITKKSNQMKSSTNGLELGDNQFDRKHTREDCKLRNKLIWLK